MKNGPIYKTNNIKIGDSVSIEEATILAETIQSLNGFQTVMFLLITLQIGLIAIIVYLIRSNSKSNSDENKQQKNQLELMTQIHQHSSRVTELSNREQKRDWQRTQYFLKQLNQHTTLLKNIFFQIGKLNSHIIKLEKTLNLKMDGENKDEQRKS